MDADLTAAEWLAKTALDIASRIHSDVQRNTLPPDEMLPPHNQRVLPHALVRDTRGYIEKVVYQINACYENTCYDACAVMLRRLIETLIIEAFEHEKIDHKIKSAAGQFGPLDDLINATLNEAGWNLGRDSRTALQRLKRLGDLSAHSRRYNARRQDIDRVMHGTRVVVEELLYLAGLR